MMAGMSNFSYLINLQTTQNFPLPMPKQNPIGGMVKNPSESFKLHDDTAVQCKTSYPNKSFLSFVLECSYSVKRLFLNA